MNRILKSIAVLLAVVALVIVAASSASAAYTRDLTLGSTGSDVVELQTFLESKGFLVIPVGVSKGYFGALTQSALAKYQSSKGIAPAVGYFGPITRAAVSAEGSVSTPSTPSTPSSSSNLKGSSGNIDDIEVMSDFSNEEVGEGQSDVEVLGLEIEADEGSDIELQNVRLEFEFAGNPGNGSNRFDRYADEVTVWLNGKEVGSADARDFSRSSSGVYRSTVQLSKAVIEAGETGELIIAVSAVSNLDSNDEGEEWTVTVLSTRYVDASGAVLTNSDAGLTENFTFEDLATASDLEFKISLDGTPKARVEDVNSTTRKSDVSVLNFNIRAQGSALWVDEIPVLLATGGTDNVGDVISRAKLTIGSKTYSENLPAGCTSGTSCTVVFDDLDYTIAKDRSVKASVTVDVKGVNDFTEGEQITATIGSTQRNAAIVEDSNGDNINNTKRTGTANGEAVAFYDKGIFVEVVSTSTSKTGTDTTSDTGNYTIVFSVTAFGDDMYIFDDASTTAATSNTVFAVSNAGTVTAVAGTLQRSDNNSTVSGTPGFKIDEGKTAKFTLTVAATATGSSAFHNVQLSSVAWTASSTASSGTAYTFDLGANAKTADLNLIVR